MTAHANTNGQPGRRKPPFLRAAWRHWQSRRLLLAWAAPTVVAPLLTMIVGDLSPTRFALCLFAGFFAWTLIEYVLHRWAMHWRPAEMLSAWRFREAVLPHDEHHETPDSATIWIINRPGGPMIIVAVIAGALSLVHTWEEAIILAFGGGLGYVAYELVHFATHKCRMEGRIGKYLMRHHLFHHYRDETVNFGVTTPLWDYVFMTIHRRKSGAVTG